MFLLRWQGIVEVGAWGLNHEKPNKNRFSKYREFRKFRFVQKSQFLKFLKPKGHRN